MIFLLDVIQVLPDLMQLFQRFESIYHHHWQDLSLPLYFISNQENLHMIHQDSNLFYDIFLRINTQKINITSLPYIDVSNPIWFLSRSDSKSPLITLFDSSEVMISMFYHSSNALHNVHQSVSLEKIKLIFIPCILFLKIDYNLFHVCFNFIKVFFNW